MIDLQFHIDNAEAQKRRKQKQNNLQKIPVLSHPNLNSNTKHKNIKQSIMHIRSISNSRQSYKNKYSYKLNQRISTQHSQHITQSNIHLSQKYPQFKYHNLLNNIYSFKEKIRNKYNKNYNSLQSISKDKTQILLFNYQYVPNHKIKPKKNIKILSKYEQNLNMQYLLNSSNPYRLKLRYNKINGAQFHH